jgi:protein-tyrosine phosphatase
MPTFCDLHNHLLPDVDDGCRTLLETAHHLRAFRADGVTELCFTPHLLAAELHAVEIDEVLDLHRARFDEVRAVLHPDTDPTLPGLFLGQEILARQVPDVEKVVARPDVGLGDSDWLLVELGFRPGFDGDGVVRRVLAEGRRIVIAHPERYAWGDADPVATLARWREMGALMQVNGGSLLDLYTARAHELGRRFLEAGLVDLVASDHHGDQRRHDPSATAEAIEAAVGAYAVAALLGTTPRRVLFDMSVTPV